MKDIVYVVDYYDLVMSWILVIVLLLSGIALGIFWISEKIKERRQKK